MTIPERLVEIREKNGYTRKRLAEELGIPYPTIRNYENGSREPGHSYIMLIAEKFDVSTDYILGIQDEKEKPPEPTEVDSRGEMKMLEDLLVKFGYIQPGQDISDRDAAFLSHLIGLLNAWFEKGS